MKIAGLILAGGAGRRMGGVDKAALVLGGITLVERAMARLGAQVPTLAIAAGPDPARFAHLDLPALPDPLADAGPLAGLLAGLVWASGAGADSVVTVAVDTPFFPDDLVERLRAAPRLPALATSPAADGSRRDEGGFGLWPVPLAASLDRALQQGTRRIAEFADAAGAVRVPFPDAAAFFNVNRPEDLRQAEALLGTGA